MMRAALVLASVGTLAAMEIATPPRTVKAVNEPLVAQTSVGSINSDDTLTEADRLELRYLRNDVPTQSASFVERMPPANSAPITLQGQKTISRHSRASNAKKGAVMLPKSRPKHADSRKTANADRSKTTVEVKSCRPNAFDSLLKAFNLSPKCET